MKSLYDKPFETDIPLIALSINECTSIAPLLKEWYENVIKNNELNSKIGGQSHFAPEGGDIFPLCPTVLAKYLM